MSDDQRTDEQLMDAWRLGGERLAFEVLFRRHAPRLFGYFRRHGLSEAHAQDLMQQTFLHLHRARMDFRAGAQVRPWLYTIAANVRRMHFRTKGRKPETGLDPDIHRPSVEPDASTARQRLVRRALDQLAAGQREVLVLHWYQGLTYPEVAAIMGISPSAAKVRANRAMHRLRAILGEDDE
ncbi:MAG: RNA polymerase sigma factor [Proteobacteria bacterium]|nr:RNA polymerase sigma factor [Pseudomonadota bacterium]MCP4921559.1 RNA polymerase sigma factor [Pseudomonadota bacterium]